MKEETLPGEALPGVDDFARGEEPDAPAALDAVKRGDEQAFAALAEKYGAMTETAVRRFGESFSAIGRSGASVYEADDLRQHAALALYRAAMTYDPQKGKGVTFGLYAKICVNNALISLLRKARSEAARRQRAEAVGGAGNPESDPLVLLLSSEDAAQLLEKVRSVLAPMEKQVFDRYMTGMSVGVIADELGTNPKSVSNALYRMKVKMKGLLQNPF